MPARVGSRRPYRAGVPVSAGWPGCLVASSDLPSEPSKTCSLSSRGMIFSREPTSGSKSAGNLPVSWVESVHCTVTSVSLSIGWTT